MFVASNNTGVHVTRAACATRGWIDEEKRGSVQKKKCNNNNNRNLTNAKAKGIKMRKEIGTGVCKMYHKIYMEMRAKIMVVKLLNKHT